MNKLTALYEVMKNMKEMKACNGNMHSEIKFGETVIAFVDGEKTTQEGKSTKKMSAVFGEETVKFERSGSESVDGCCGHGHHMCCSPSPFVSQFHKSHGLGEDCCGTQSQGKEENCCGPQYHGKMRFGKISKAMMLIKLLDQLNYNESENTLSLEMTLSDLPENIQKHMKEHLAFKKEHIKSMLSTCCDSKEDSSCCEGEDHHKLVMEHLKKVGLFEIDIDSIEPKNINVSLKLDVDSKPREMKASFEIDATTKNGESKPIVFTMNGKVL